MARPWAPVSGKESFFINSSIETSRVMGRPFISSRRCFKAAILRENKKSSSKARRRFAACKAFSSGGKWTRKTASFRPKRL
jgi:hypothetical protein